MNLERPKKRAVSLKQTAQSLPLTLGVPKLTSLCYVENGQVFETFKLEGLFLVEKSQLKVFKGMRLAFSSGFETSYADIDETFGSFSIEVDVSWRSAYYRRMDPLKHLKLSIVDHRGKVMEYGLLRLLRPRMKRSLT